MNLTDVLKKVALPLATLATGLGMTWLTVVLLLGGSLMGAVCTALLAGVSGFFTYRDAKMLLAEVKK